MNMFNGSQYGRQPQSRERLPPARHLIDLAESSYGAPAACDSHPIEIPPISAHRPIEDFMELAAGAQPIGHTLTLRSAPLPDPGPATFDRVSPMPSEYSISSATTYSTDCEVRPVIPDYACNPAYNLALAHARRKQRPVNPRPRRGVRAGGETRDKVQNAQASRKENSESMQAMESCLLNLCGITLESRQSRSNRTTSGLIYGKQEILDVFLRLGVIAQMEGWHNAARKGPEGEREWRAKQAVHAEEARRLRLRGLSPLEETAMTPNLGDPEWEEPRNCDHAEGQKRCTTHDAPDWAECHNYRGRQVIERYKEVWRALISEEMPQNQTCQDQGRELTRANL